MLRFKRCLKHDIMDFEKRIEMIRKIELSNKDSTKNEDLKVMIMSKEM